MHQLSTAPQHSLAPEELTARAQETLRETESQTEAFKQQYVQAATQLVGVKVGSSQPVSGGHRRAERLSGREHSLHKRMLQQRRAVRGEGCKSGACLCTALLNTTSGCLPAAD